MTRIRLIAVMMSSLVAATLGATSFIVPTDEELAAKSPAIVVGSVEGSTVRRTATSIETVYSIRVQRTLKGLPRTEQNITVASPGGFLPGVGGVVVPGAAHFRQNERVLLFLRPENGRFVVTDMTLGKFRFANAFGGERLLVRDMEDVSGWDREGMPHREQLRREDQFLRALEEHIHGRRPIAAQSDDYLVEASGVELIDEEPRVQSLGVEEGGIIANAPAFPPKTYTDNVSDGTQYQGIRWSTMAAGVRYYKRADQNISGAADGGVGAIQSGLAAWNNECGSVINLIYGGTTGTASANFDGINVVEYNDPQNRISGSWTGAGTVGITFLSFTAEHTFAGEQWWSITDADVVFQNGYPATHAAFAAAMTHELGHSIGWRHSNEHYIKPGACNAAVEECSTSAIMNSQAIASLGYNLQTWDINAAQAVYPGGTCGTPPPPPTGADVAHDFNGDGRSDLLWRHGTTGNNSVWLMNGASTITSAAISALATGWRVRGADDFNGDLRDDILWRNDATGETAIWFMNGTTVTSSTYLTAVAPVYRVEGVGDFNNDGRADILWRNSSDNATVVWLMNGATIVSSATIAVPPSEWVIQGVGDFDGDGNTDILWRSTQTSQAVVWRMSGTTILSNNYIASPNSSWVVNGVGDFNADGKADILWRNTSTLQVVIWFMNGTTLLSSAYVSNNPPANWQVQSVGDFNGDGRTDIFWRNTTTGENVIWLMNGATITSSGNTTPNSDQNWRVVA